VVAIHDGEDLAVDHIEHLLPCLGVDTLQAIGVCAWWQLIWGRSKPDFKELLWACEVSQL
jgi:hypothetical protein